MTTDTTGVPTGAEWSVTNNTFTLKGWIPATQDTSGNWIANGSTENTDGLRLSMNSTTSYNTETARMSQSQDGYATGILSSLSIDSTG